MYYGKLFNLLRYTPQFDLVLAFILAVLLIRGIKQKTATRRTDAWYLFRVLLRYRLALSVAAYGFIKLFPMQLPYPSLSLLNTNYGDLSDWKIASLSYGVAPSFESFLGGIEVLAALLLLWRKTASIGAALVIGFTGNVLLSNLAYGGGETVYCLLLLSMAAILVWYDWGRWYKLIITGLPTHPDSYKPQILNGWTKKAGWAARTIFLLLFVTMGVAARSLHSRGAYQYPQKPGLSKSEGLYNVSEFRLNGKLLPYSLKDSVRWQNVVFEKWNTLSIATNRLVQPDIQNREFIPAADVDRVYESTGSSGRCFYSYTADTVRRVLRLQNKNRHYAGDVLELAYSRPDNEHIIITGKNARHDSIYARLDKMKKVYLLNESVEIPRQRSAFE